MILMVSPDVSSRDELISKHIQLIWIGRGSHGFQKGNFRPNEDLLVGPVAPNEVVKGSKLAQLVNPDVYP